MFIKVFKIRSIPIMTIPRKVTYLQFLWDVSKFCYELVRENEQRYAKYKFGGLW